MRTKTVSAQTLSAFASALEAKRVTAAAAAAASAEVRRMAEEFGLPAESILLRADDKSFEIAALWTERSVREIPSRVDRFHSFKSVYPMSNAEIRKMAAKG